MTTQITTHETLRATVSNWRTGGDSIALVPTMGALHRGHLALVAQAKQQAARVVVSIFVNPTQFGPNEDFNRYPRPLEEDLAHLQAAGADAVWLPSVAVMYPPGFSSSIHVGGITEMLEGEHRPGHFNGVATVVAKLFQQVMPDIALFGEKDYQQLCVIRRVVRDLDMPVRVVGIPTVREADGLALSSRNRYLSAEERAIAPTLYATLQDAAAALRAGTDATTCCEQASARLLAGGFRAVDYVALRDPESLLPWTPGQPGRLLVAAWLGTTRLIDNITVE